MIPAFRSLLMNYGKQRRPGHGFMFSLCKVFMMGYYNCDSNANTNGESKLIKELAQQGIGDVFFDVGANVGEWTNEVLEFFPSAHVHAFEVSPRTYKSLMSNVSPERTNLNMFGLSNEAGNFTLQFNEETPVTSSLHEGAGLNRSADAKIIEESVETRIGDDYCAEHGIEQIDYLKIDTEGHDFSVLEGFTKMLEAGKIKRIQFEYSKTAISAGSYLRNFYDLLDENYVIHRITPVGVIPESYDWFSENFLFSNFFAVHRSLL